jgi:hypothetical protein
MSSIAHQGNFENAAKIAVVFGTELPVPSAKESY